jgi:hypothetical protein
MRKVPHNTENILQQGGAALQLANTHVAIFAQSLFDDVR